MWFLAIRYILARKRQTFLILLGVILGTIAYISISGIMSGFQSYIIEHLVNNDAHIRVTPGERFVIERSLEQTDYPEAAHVFWTTPPSGGYFNPRISSPQRWFHFLEKEEDVAAFTPQLIRDVSLKRTGISKPARLIGTDILKQTKVTSIENFMIDGHFEELGKGKNRLILGAGLLKKLGANPDDAVFIINKQNESFPFQIAGVFRTGVSGIDDNNAFTALADAQLVQHASNEISDIAIRLKDPAKARDRASRWGLLFSEKVQSWDQINANLLAIFNLQHLIGALMIAAVLAITGFGIYNTLFMLISNKRQEIAILRSLGYDSREIGRLFLFQGLFFGLIGGLLGCVLGYVTCRYVQTIPMESLRVAQYGRLIISFSPVIYAKGFLVALFSCVTASTLPAMAAGRLAPMEVIRNE